MSAATWVGPVVSPVLNLVETSPVTSLTVDANCDSSVSDENFKAQAPEAAEQLGLFRLQLCENSFSRCFIGNLNSGLKHF